MFDVIAAMVILFEVGTHFCSNALTLDTVAILCLIHSNFGAVEIMYKVLKRQFEDLAYYFNCAEISKLTKHIMSRVLKVKKNQRIRKRMCKCHSPETFLSPKL